MAPVAQAGLFRRPALATTYEGEDSVLLERILPLVDYLEITPDTIARASRFGASLNPAIVQELKAVVGHQPILVHGVGLSIASADGISERYIHLLDEVFSNFHVLWHSEHLAYTDVEGESLGTMLAPPRSAEMLDLICERVRLLQARYNVPFMLENVVRLLPDAPADYSEAGFLNAITERTGCDLLLDAYNLECNSKNLGLDTEAFLKELDFRHVREIHLAGGVSYRGFQLDVHSRRVAESTYRLLDRILPCALHTRVLTYEFLSEAVPTLGHDAICAELSYLRGTYCA